MSASRREDAAARERPLLALSVIPRGRASGDRSVDPSRRLSLVYGRGSFRPAACEASASKLRPILWGAVLSLRTPGRWDPRDVAVEGRDGGVRPNAPERVIRFLEETRLLDASQHGFQRFVGSVVGETF